MISKPSGVRLSPSFVFNRYLVLANLILTESEPSFETRVGSVKLILTAIPVSVTFTRKSTG